MDRLLTDEEINAVVETWANEDFSTRGLSIELGRGYWRGYWEDIASLIAKAQDVKTLKRVGEFLSLKVNHRSATDYPSGRTITIWKEEMEALLRGEMPGEGSKISAGADPYCP